MLQFYRAAPDTGEGSPYFSFQDHNIGFNRADGFNGTDWSITTWPNPPIPRDVKIFVSEGIPPDFLITPIGWEFWSDRAAARIERFAGDAVHFVDAPLYRYRTKRPVPGFKVIIATKMIPCLDLQRSKYSTWNLNDDDDPSSVIMDISQWVFDQKKVPLDLHVFRAEESRPALFFSRALMLELMSGEYLEDLAFVQYGGEGDDQGANIRRHRPKK